MTHTSDPGPPRTYGGPEADRMVEALLGETSGGPDLEPKPASSDDQPQAPQVR